MSEIVIEKINGDGIKFSAKGEISLQEFMHKLGQLMTSKNICSLAYPTLYFRKGKTVQSDEIAVWDVKTKKITQKDVNKISKSMTKNAIRPLRNDKCEYWD
jgi:hypothetical protein